jgi:hypothetical protein
MFLEQADALIVGMEKALGIVEPKDDKPGREKPDQAALGRLREAAENFSIDGIEDVLNDLESYEYQSEGELIVWLRKKCDTLAFDEIALRLSACA